MTEAEYLANYDPKVFKAQLLTVDAVLFTYHDQQLKVLLVQRSNHPFLGLWGLPGGFIDENCDQSLEQTVLRKLQEKTAVVPPYIEQLCTVGNCSRDIRGWSVTVCYTALMSYQACQIQIDSVSDVKWWPLVDVLQMPLAFDHLQLIEQARERLTQKALYSLVPGFALSEPFTLPELQHVHEVLLGKPIQGKSFRRRVEQADLLIDTGLKRTERGRPANLYRLKPNTASYRFLRNLEC
ncbi:NUDIX hydrolase [Shewanella sp. W3-18-1]|uniref:NUDIX hydrolase n=1 Tax=Shewanella sp. (strain W3-18-1) TaxID=351745 RepID=UPI00005FDC73|nr:NUDIX domain-containing protein [Shewanella sp. W3-18-1]ABM24517.1 NUDIX hydrolase [Shewanella sp. W3-18-1]